MGFHEIEYVFLLLLLFLIGFGTLAKWLKVPYPIVLVIGGLLVSLLPGLPRIALNPDLVLFVMLPPLLFSAAYHTSWREFRRNLATIFSLAFLLVAFTTVAIAAVAHWLIPDLDWRTGLVLGAILSPTDAIAATAIGQRLHLPKRISDLLEAESLVNDGSALLALQFATGIVVTGRAPGVLQGLWELIYLVLVGIAAGLVVGHILYVLQKRIEDTSIEVTVSLVTPFLAYFAAEAIHASGVLSVVACGLYLGRRTSLYVSTGARIEAYATWNTLTFILNGIAFLMIGLQLPNVRQEIRGLGPSQLLADAVGVVLSVILVRLVWVFARQFVSRRLLRRLLHRRETNIRKRALFIIGWTGMRGVISLAAALSLPASTQSGAPFPDRNIILYITFCVIFVTLVLQGLTLPLLIKRLGLGGSKGIDQEELEARRKVTRAALESLRGLREKDPKRHDNPAYDEYEERYEARMQALNEVASDPQSGDNSKFDYRLYRLVGRQLREVERATAVRLRDQGEIDDEVLRRIERELDLLDTRDHETL